jgi:hypothetical protein
MPKARARPREEVRNGRRSEPREAPLPRCGDRQSADSRAAAQRPRGPSGVVSQELQGHSPFPRLIGYALNAYRYSGAPKITPLARGRLVLSKRHSEVANDVLRLEAGPKSRLDLFEDPLLAIGQQERSSLLCLRCHELRVPERADAMSTAAEPLRCSTPERKLVLASDERARSSCPCSTFTISPKRLRDRLITHVTEELPARRVDPPPDRRQRNEMRSSEHREAFLERQHPFLWPRAAKAPILRELLGVPKAFPPL